MRPRPYVQLQAIAVLIVAAVAALILGPGAALAMAIALSVGCAIWGYFALLYALRRRRSEPRRSADRASKDRAMVLCLFLGFLLPLGLLWCDVGLDGLGTIESPLGQGESVLTALCLVLIPLSMLVSSSVDWYLIRPFREGVHDLPACQPEIQAGSRAMDYARYWILHRMVAEFFVYAAIVGLIALIATIVGQRTDSETGKNIFNLIGLVGIVGWSLSELGKLKAALEFVRYPTCSLASWVAGRNDAGQDISGFVLDVSIDPGIQLIEEPRGHPAWDVASKDRSVPLKYRRTIEPIQARTPVCPGRDCEFWIPDCEVGLRRLERESGGESEQHPVGAPVG